MIIDLQLRPNRSPTAALAGWFLPGASVARWMEELTRAGWANTQTRLFVVARSVQDLTPAGLLVVPGLAASAVPKSGGVACALVAGRLFIPVEATLHPPISDAEVTALSSAPLAFFHPSSGLSGFPAEAALGFADLIQVPEERVGNWNFARPGAPILPRLNGIVLAQPPTFEDVFGGAETEIGTESPVDLPPAPEEPKSNPLPNLGRQLRRLLANGISKTVQRLPHTSAHRTWLNSLEDWAREQAAHVGEQLEQIRHKELHRLLELFRTDPDSALRHAIPMNAFAHRGLSPPGGRLGSRSPNLDLSRLGGQAADFWNVPGDLQELLRGRYREMADREMRLGRHRRAAYIYAELLGDLISAANVLKQGHHFREAAFLYEEHLRNPLEAAHCLAQGGLFPEALELYARLGRWLDAADLHERLGNRAAAESALRRAVSERAKQDDILGAAKLLDERLKSPEEALDLLLRAWPASRQAAACLGAALQIWARLGRHEPALERLALLARERIPSRLALPLLSALYASTRNFPHPEVRRRTSDLARVLIARQLAQPAVSTEDARRLLDCLVQLAPEDRLLARDANRHLTERRALLQRPRILPLKPVQDNGPVLLRQFELPRQMEWLQLRNEWNWFYAAGVTQKRLTIVRGIWEGEFQSLSWECPAQAAKSGLLFRPTNQRGLAVLLAIAAGPPLPEKSFPAADLFFGTECLVGTPAWFKPQEWPVAFGDESVWTAHLAAGRAILSALDKNGTLQRTLDVTQDLLDEAVRGPETRLCLTAIGNHAAVALGNRLVVTRSGATPLRIELPGQAVSLLPTLPHMRAGLVILLDQGAVLFWLGTPGLIELDRDLELTMGAFVPGGPLVLVSRTRLLFLEVDIRGVQRVTQADVPRQRLIGVSSTNNPGQFALLDAAGAMSVYRIAS